MQPTSFAPLRFAALLCTLFHSLSVALAGDYRLEIAARPENFPPDPGATQRSYLHHQINNKGDILFSAHWRDANGVRRSAIHAGPPGAVGTVVAGGDPIAEFPGFAFTGGPDRVSLGNFPAVTFNALGEVWFNGFIYGEDASPGSVLPFSQGFWKVSLGKVKLVGATPDFNPNFNFPFGVANVPYSGQGRLQWTGSFGGFRMADIGVVFFRGDIKAYVANVGLEFVLNQGLISHDSTNGLRLITYPGDQVGTFLEPWVFNSFSLFHVGHKNAALVLDATLEGTRTNVNLGQRKRVFYHNFVPVYTEKDPLPDLPPLPELLGTDEPFDLLASLQGADGTGNFIFSVSASARNRIGGAPMGIWKWDSRARKLVKVFRFQEPLPTPGGPVQLNTNVAVLAKIGNNKTVFVASFTGLGYTSPTTGLFQENGTNFTLIAATGTVVPGTNSNFILGANIGSGLVTSDFYANESSDVLFAASFRTNATIGPSFQGMWAWRDGTLHSVIRAGQQMSIDGTNRTIRSFGYSALDSIFNDLGMFMANVFFTNSTLPIIVRASPEAGDLPCCESQRRFSQFRQVGGQSSGPWRASADPAVCDLFTFTAADDNWHSPNWDDGRGQPHCDPPGDAAPNTARVMIPPLSDVLLDQRAAPIGSLDSRGHLTLRERLTVNKTATVTDLVVEGPSGGVTLTNGAQMTVDTTLWKTGTLSMAGGQIPAPASSRMILSVGASFASLDTFLAESGTIEALSGNPVFENYGTFRKDGPAAFAIRAPYNVVQPVAGATRTEVLAGVLQLMNGGTFESDPVFHAAAPSTLELSGEYRLLGPGALFEGNGVVDLGSPDRPIIFQGPQRSYVTFRLRDKAASFHRGELRGEGAFVNEGNFVWTGGTISLLVDRFFDNKGSLLIEPGPQERKLRGKLRHLSGSLRQRADVDLSEGAILSQADWDAVGPFRILGSDGLVTLERTNFGFFYEPASSKLRIETGLVEVECAFDNQDGDVFVDDGATLRLKNVRNIQGARLSRGTWEIGPGGLLETSGSQIEYVAAGTLDIPTVVIYGGRGWPQFRPNGNNGIIALWTNLLLKSFVNEYRFHIRPGGHLEIEGDFAQKGFPASLLGFAGGLYCEQGKLTVRGDLINTGRTETSAGAILDLKKQLINSGGVAVGLGDTNPSQLLVGETVINQGTIDILNSTLRTGVDFINGTGLARGGPTPTLRLNKRAQAVIGSRLSNRGYVSVGANSTLKVTGNLEVVGADENEESNLTVINYGELEVGGSLSLDGKSSKLLVTDSGLVVVRGVLSNRFGLVRVSGGTLRVGKSYFTREATLSGEGVIYGDGTVEGLTSPGTSPGTLSIVGNFDQTNTSVLVIEVAGTATNQFDRLLVSQTASIGGTLAINVLDGFRPAPSDTFIVLEAGRLTNQFANATNGQRIATFGGFGSFQVNYTPTNLVLSAFEANPNPPLPSPGRLLAPTFGFDTVELTLTGSSGHAYILQTSTNLLDWLSLLTNNASFDGSLRFELPATPDPHRFFRALNK